MDSKSSVVGDPATDVREWLHSKLESTFGLDASVYGSYLEGFLQSETASTSPSSSPSLQTGDRARADIREVLLAAALDQEAVVDEFVDQLMQRWTNRPNGGHVKGAVNNKSPPSYSAAVSAQRQQHQAKDSSGSSTPAEPKPKPQAIGPPGKPRIPSASSSSPSSATAAAGSFPGFFDGGGGGRGPTGTDQPHLPIATAEEDFDVNDENEDEEMRLNTESMVSALLGDDFGGGAASALLSTSSSSFGDADPDVSDSDHGVMMLAGGLSLDEYDDDDEEGEGEEDHHHHQDGGGFYDLNNHYYAIGGLHSNGGGGAAGTSLGSSYTRSSPFASSPLSGSPATSFLSFTSPASLSSSPTATTIFVSSTPSSSSSSSSPVVKFVDSTSLSSSPSLSSSSSSSSLAAAAAAAKDEAFEMLVSMFSDYEREGLQQLYDANDKDMERTVAILLEIEREEGESNPNNTAHPRGYDKGSASTPGAPAPGASAKGIPVDTKQVLNKTPDVVAPPNASNIVCRYYLKGKCFRADCWYSHDLKSVTCKYWMAGECLKGDMCEFRHGYDPQQLQSRTQKITTDYATSFPSLPSSAPYKQPPPPSSPSAFSFGAKSKHVIAGGGVPSATSPPSSSLSSSSSSSSSSSLAAGYPSLADAMLMSAAPLTSTNGGGGGGGGGDLNMAQRLKLQKLHEEFQDLVEEEVVREAFHRSGLSYETAKAGLLAAFPDLAGRKQERDREREREKARQQSKQTSAAVQQKKLTDIIKGLKKKNNKVGWVETGESVGEQYSALRDRAIEHARIRNRLFQEATQAYLVGNKSAATQLSAQGRYHQKKMEELHQQASQQIFQSRNASHPDVLDLHGLHVDEALSILETFLLKQERELVEGPSSSRPSNAKSAVATATGLYNGTSSSSSSSSSSSASALSSSSTGSGGATNGVGGVGGAAKARGTLEQFKLVYVITGTGHHSQGKKARLQPAVVKYLTERGYTCADTSPDGRGGMLTITIKPVI